MMTVADDIYSSYVISSHRFTLSQIRNLTIAGLSLTSRNRRVALNGNVFIVTAGSTAVDYVAFKCVFGKKNSFFAHLTERS